MVQDFIPRSEADKVIWLGNFSTNIAIQGPVVGLTPGQVLLMQSACTNIVDAIAKVESKKAAVNEAVAAKNLISSMALKAIRETSAQMKTNSSYSISIGESLGIIGAGIPFDPAAFKPEITVSNFAEFVRIKFEKKGVDGINIYHRQKGAVVWQFLARDTKSPYDDHIVLATPGQPEHWEYRAYGVIDDFQIGMPSDIVEIVFGG